MLATPADVIRPASTDRRAIARSFGDQCGQVRRGTNLIAYRSVSMRRVCVSTHPWHSATSWSSTRVTVCRPDAFLWIATGIA
jgi:hypothetical protein